MVDLGSISGRSRADLGSISQANYVDFAMLSRLSNVDHNTSTYSNDRCAKSEIKEELSRMAASGSAGSGRSWCAAAEQGARSEYDS